MTDNKKKSQDDGNAKKKKTRKRVEAKPCYKLIRAGDILCGTCRHFPVLSTCRHGPRLCIDCHAHNSLCLFDGSPWHVTKKLVL